MVEPLRPTVKLVVPHEPPSAIHTWLPEEGVAGKVTVNVPPVVSAIAPWLLVSVVLEVKRVYAIPPVAVAQVGALEPLEVRTCPEEPAAVKA